MERSEDSRREGRTEGEALGTALTGRPGLLVGLVAVVTAVAALHTGRALQAIGTAFGDARGRGDELVVARGDVAVRDVPKALRMRNGRLFEDPHYAGEPHWYPFATPAVAAAVSRVFRLPINEAYFGSAAVLSGLALVGFAVLLASFGGTLGLALFSVMLLAGVGWPSTGAYPFETAVLPFTLFFVAAAAAVRAVGGAESSPGRAPLVAMGLLGGLLGIWHGASFLVASFVSAYVFARLVVRALNHPAERRETLLRAGLLTVTILVPFALLVGPQIIHYGHLRQSDAARLYLEPWYRGGDDWGALVRGALVPRGWGLLWLCAFAAGFARFRDARPTAMPLAIAYVVGKVLAHAGFVVNSVSHPTAAAIARRVLLVPPHTLNHVAEVAFGFMQAWLAVAIARAVLRSKVADGLRQGWERRGLSVRHRVVQRVVGAAAFAVATAVVVGRMPPADKPYARPAALDTVRFAERLSAMAGPDDVVLGANGLIHMAALNLLWIDAPEHANPYVAEEREAAMAALERGAAAGDRRAISEVLRRYRVRFTVGDSVVARMCGEAVVLVAPDGSPVVRLREGCAPR